MLYVLLNTTDMKGLHRAPPALQELLQEAPQLRHAYPRALRRLQPPEQAPGGVIIGGAPTQPRVGRATWRPQPARATCRKHRAQRGAS